ncbi:MAG: DNA-directed RNA polymerase subunit beta' [candidate division WOR-3 bacterium]
MARIKTDNITDISPISLKGISISLASPEDIMLWSYAERKGRERGEEGLGEVEFPETINYRTQRPEKGGLFCERIFGPTKDYECACGHYKGKRYAGITCEKCGVEVTTSQVRRERMGYVKLAVPVAHIWFYKVPPSIIATLLDVNKLDLEDVLYYDAYIVTDPGDTPLEKCQILSESEYQEKRDEFGPGSFVAEMGAPPIKKLLDELFQETTSPDGGRKTNLENLYLELQTYLKVERSALKRARLLKKLRIVEAFINSGNNPAWMILEVLPVIPPDLRPLVPLEGGRYATSDLNDLYRHVISRNNRLKHMMDIRAPEIILRNEKRMLQEAVDALLDNSRRKKPVTGRGGRKLKSLSDILRGKHGRLRRNLLGKRVDYSGRSVIVVGPDLKLNQAGLPKEMAVELFKPFIERKLEDSGLAKSSKSARKLLQKRHEGVWEMLEDVTRRHPIWLNRAPTLHRVSVQAFDPVLVEGKAITIHPLVCNAFNADFDGDQMAVHVPISLEAQAESYYLLYAPHNIMSPAHGKPLAAPTKDMVAGLSYLTKAKGFDGEPTRSFSDWQEALSAYDAKIVGLTSPIMVMLKAEGDPLDTAPGGRFVPVKTTVGRLIFNSILPRDMRAAVGYINETQDKKSIQNLVSKCFKILGTVGTTELLDNLKDAGFLYATISALTFGIDDLLIPSSKSKIIKKAFDEVERVNALFREGELSRAERYQNILDIWTRTTEEVKRELSRCMAEDREGFNPIHIIVSSGARGNMDQVRQLAGMRGLMARPVKKGEIGDLIETPILSSLKEGLSSMEYFISTHGSRKSLSDTALKTANAGHLTRRLVDVAQEVTITEHDCGTVQGRRMTALKEGETVIKPLSERIVGRVAFDDIFDPETGELIVREGEEIDEDAAARIESAGIEEVTIRSVLYCEAERGLCAKCYGRNLATGRLVEIGEAVGVMAAQSIGEPGTQLTLRTFHTGGVSERIAQQAAHFAAFAGKVEFRGLILAGKKKARSVLSRKGVIVLRDETGKRERVYRIPYGSKVLVSDGQEVNRGDMLCEWEPYALPILVSKRGRLKLVDVIPNITLRETVEENKVEYVIYVSRQRRLYPKAVILDERTGEVIEEVALVHECRLAGKAIDAVKSGETAELPLVEEGDIIAKVSAGIAKTRDITGGLPRVEELFEARSPADKALVSEIAGVVSIESLEKGVFKIKVVPKEGKPVDYDVPYGRYLLVGDGEAVEAGEPLTTGSIDPHDLLRIRGKEYVQEYLFDQIQEVYRLSSVEIDDKHIEIIVRQMLRKVRIEDPGDTKFLPGDLIDLARVKEENAKIVASGGRPAQHKVVLLGITRAALSTDSFIAAASFQDTTKVLSMAAISGATDELRGLKENVIIGSLIPAGTGAPPFREIVLEAEKAEAEAAEKAIPKE